MSHPLAQHHDDNNNDDTINQIFIQNNNSTLITPAPRGRSVSAASDLIDDPHRTLYRQQKAPTQPATTTTTTTTTTSIKTKNYFEQQCNQYQSQMDSFMTQKVAITLTPNQKKWTYYKCSPVSNATTSTTSSVIAPPLIVLHDICCQFSLHSFYQQILSLVPRGYHVILVDIAPCYTHDEFVLSFHELCDYHIMSSLNGKFHLMGVGMGGFLAQCYAEKQAQYISSLILCNSFVNNSWFSDTALLSDFYQLAPNFLLRMKMEGLFSAVTMEGEKLLVLSNEFMYDSMCALSKEQNASRLRLLCSSKKIDRSLFEKQLPDDRVTVIQTMDPGSLYPISIRNELQEYYPDARYAMLKDGGTFPYLCRAEEFNLHLIVHMRNVAGQNLPTYEKEDNENDHKSSNEDNNDINEGAVNHRRRRSDEEVIDHDSLVLIEESNEDEYDVHETDIAKQQDPSHRGSMHSPSMREKESSDVNDDEPIF